MLAKIRSGLTLMTPSERRVAETILANPQAAIAWSMADAARLSGVSEPSVMRFCRRLDFDGYSDFRITLAQAVALNRQPEGEAPLSDEARDPVHAEVLENCNRAIASIRDLAGDVDREALVKAVDILRHARRIDIYGHGGSGFLAGETQHRLSHIGLCAMSYADPGLQMFSAMSLRAEDCVMVFSFSGVTTHPMPNLDIAKNAGSKIISMAPTGSPIARMADVNLAVNAYRQKQDRGFLPSERVSMYVLIDILTNLLQRA